MAEDYMTTDAPDDGSEMTIELEEGSEEGGEGGRQWKGLETVGDSEGSCQARREVHCCGCGLVGSKHDANNFEQRAGGNGGGANSNRGGSGLVAPELYLGDLNHEQAAPVEVGGNE